MIRQLTIVRSLRNAAQFRKLAALLDSIGFEPGPTWKSKASEGAGLLAPVGNLELYYGTEVAEGDVLVEVSNLEDVHRRVEEAKLGEVGPITATSWKSHLFQFRLQSFTLAFWQFDHPRKLPAQVVEGDLYVKGARYGIVVSRFNQMITERLLQGALDALHRTGASDKNIEIVRVPGAFEVPIGARKLAATGKVDAVICLGLLMRGETSNYEHISQEVARGIGESAQATEVPHAYGVLTCDTLEQAIQRAGLKMGNKGFEAAISAVEMVSLSRKLPARSRRSSKPAKGNKGKKK
jgi:6,7-dimethyl-8-ribityllumazine synthase